MVILVFDEKTEKRRKYERSIKTRTYCVRRFLERALSNWSDRKFIMVNVVRVERIFSYRVS